MRAALKDGAEHYQIQINLVWKLSSVLSSYVGCWEIPCWNSPINWNPSFIGTFANTVRALRRLSTPTRLRESEFGISFVAILCNHAGDPP